MVQFLYGEDGMDGTAIEAQKLESLRMSPNKFRVCHSLSLSQMLLAGCSALCAELSRILSARPVLRMLHVALSLACTHMQSLALLVVMQQSSRS